MSKYFAEENQPNNSKPACLKPPCQTKKIRAKFYFSNELWDQMRMKNKEKKSNLTNQVD